MVFTDYGLRQLGSFIAGLSPTYPGYIGFGAGSLVFTGDENYLNDEFLRKSVTWTFFENKPVADVTIATTEANGSVFNEFGLGQGASTGSDLYSRDFSAIGTKNKTFDVDHSVTIQFRRAE